MTIRAVGGGKYKVFSEKTGKPLSKATSKAGAAKRLQQVEYFKRHPEAGKHKVSERL